MLVLWAGIALTAFSQEYGPDDLFLVTASLANNDAGDQVVRVMLGIREPGHIYTNSIRAEIDDKSLEQVDAPPGVKIDDPARGPTEVYDRDTILTYRLASGSNPTGVVVRYQGCTDSTCFMPKSVSIDLSHGGKAAPPGISPDARVPAPTGSWRPRADGFRTVARTVGYVKSRDFIAFLKGGAGTGELTILLILLGGLALNLTPCVLPMIPVNLAIIGAGAGAGSRKRGFALGGVYGLGIASAYGLLGAAFVKAGVRFGSVQSLPAFNLAIGALFLVLALGMFDVITIDFSRWQKGGGSDTGRSFAIVLVMGMIAAVLAGACVAPVVIAVLIYSSSLYNAGHVTGLVYPFLLGLGMALPWPFAGAGLSFLPKPGRWMVTVKHAFGVLIVLLAVYYCVLGIKGMRRSHVESAHPGWLTSLDEALAQAEARGKPVIIDFAADWCKNCEAMDRTTFRDPLVLRELDRFIKIRFAADDQRDPAVKEVLDYFKVIGLPTYVVLEEKK